jgi:hypothetical protein
MRIGSFERMATNSWGVLEGQKIVDLGADALLGAPTLVEALQSGGLIDIAGQAVGRAPEIDQALVHWLPPVPTPQKAIYVDRLALSESTFDRQRLDGAIANDRREIGMAIESVSHPSIFGSESSLVPEGHHVSFFCWPALAAIVGSTAESVAYDRGEEFLAGYAPYIHYTGIQYTEARAESIAPAQQIGFCGPWMTTRDEWRPNTQVGHLLNRGSSIGTCTTSSLTGSVGAIVVACSRLTRLEVGDVIVIRLSVTKSSNACLRIDAGDKITLELPGLGSLFSHVRRGHFEDAAQISSSPERVAHSSHSPRGHDGGI